MKCKLFQTVLIVATIVTWVAPLQAFNTVNNTDYEIAVWGSGLVYGEKILPNATSHGWYYTGKSEHILLSVCVCSTTPCKGSATWGYVCNSGTAINCFVSPHGQQIVTPSGNPDSPLSLTCS